LDVNPYSFHKKNQKKGKKKKNQKRGSRRRLSEENIGEVVKQKTDPLASAKYEKSIL